jgi:glycosyltransferase involved in cell wall biosynthesis
VGEAIQSALNQTYPAHEVIVVDDGSTDNTSEIVATFGQAVRYIYQPNAGLSAARNTGLREATGDYIGLLDADDLWLPEFLATLVPMLEADASLGAVYGGCRFVDECKNPLPQTTMRVVPPDRVHDTLIDGDFFPPVVVLTRKKCFDRCGLFDESLRASEDWDMWLRVSAEYPLRGTPQIVALYRMHGDNMTRDLERMHESMLAVARKHFGPVHGDSTVCSLQHQRAYAGIYLWRALAHYQRGETCLGREYVRRAMLSSPAMADRLDAFYALGCADQPPGYVGDLKHLNLGQNADRLLEALDAAFSDPGIADELKSKRRLAYSTAYLALGILAYGSRRLGLARGYLIRAAWWRPALLANGRWMSTFVRALLPNPVTDVLRRLRHRRQTSG